MPMEKTIKLSQIVDIKYLLTEEEYNAVMEIRERNAEKERINQHKEQLVELVIATLDAIGLEETKRIIREINRELREREK